MNYIFNDLFCQYELTIGEILNKLESYSDNKGVIFSDTSITLSGDYYSYRGSYCQLAMEIIDCNNTDLTVGVIRKILKTALSDGEMYGYKGGEYPINLNTELRLARSDISYGEPYIVDVFEINDKVCLVLLED